MPLAALFRPLLEWFKQYWVLLAEALLVLGLLTGRIGASFGLPDLFWHERHVMQLVAGLAVGLLLADLGLTGFLLDGDEAWVAQLGVPPLRRFRRSSDRALVRYLLRTTGVLLCAVALTAFTVPDGIQSALLLPLGAALGAGALPGLLLLVWHSDRLRSAVMRWVPGAALPAAAMGQPELDALAFWYALAKLLLYLLLWALYSSARVEVSVALLICLMLALVTSVYSRLKRHYPGRSFPVVLAGTVVLLVVNAPSAHRLPHLSYEASTLFPVRDYETRALQPDLIAPAAALEAWRGRQGAEKPPLVVVAVDGGGIRAAVWATSVLTRLEEDLPGLPHAVRIVTGASGGMIGAAFFVASLRAEGGHRDLAGVALDRASMLERAGQDSLEAVSRHLLFRDLLPAPWHPENDRGRAIEDRWADSTRVLGMRFVDLAAGEREGWRPSLIVSPVLVEDGRRLLISNLDLHDLATLPSRSFSPPFVSLQALEFFRMFPDGASLSLSSAVRMSATFPYVMPAVELPTDPVVRAVDAGYYDDHGVDLAALWMFANREWIARNAGGVALVQIPDTRSEEARRRPTLTPRPWWARGARELTTPIEAVLHTRDAAMAFHNDGLVSLLDRSLDDASSPSFFRTFVFEPAAMTREQGARDQDVALSWHLSSREQRHLAEAFDDPGNCARRQALREWWGRHGGREAAPGPPAGCAAGGRTGSGVQ